MNIDNNRNSSVAKRSFGSENGPGSTSAQDDRIQHAVKRINPDSQEHVQIVGVIWNKMSSFEKNKKKDECFNVFFKRFRAHCNKNKIDETRFSACRLQSYFDDKHMTFSKAAETKKKNTRSKKAANILLNISQAQV